MIAKVLEKIGLGSSCCGSGGAVEAPAGPKAACIALVGSPNVGKSVLFGNLTRTYVTVSNYPGTTVEVTRGHADVGGRSYDVIDTPGMYSMLPLSEEERVARDILFERRPEVVLHVVDAKNLGRMLIFTVQLIEAGLPVALVVNLLDEAEARGLTVDIESLRRDLGIPVVGTVCTAGRGMAELRKVIADGIPPAPADRFRYPSRLGASIESYVERLEGLLRADYALSRRALALLLLQEDEGTRRVVSAADPETYDEMCGVVREAEGAFAQPVDYVLTMARRDWAAATESRAVHQQGRGQTAWQERLSRLLVRPLTGVPILLLVLYLGLYKVVGQFGAGTVVDFMEHRVFQGWLNPLLTHLTQAVIPWPWLQSLFVGDYGMLTLGLRYAVAIILPVIVLFFLIFAFIEDVGYLPRLALLLDRVFKKIGLSGRAVIPMVLGFACDTMATMVTRTLSTRRERLIAIVVLSVAVPCSAQLGVIIALLSQVPGALVLWAVVMLAVALAAGYMASRVIPGRPAPFYVEIPPLRLPKLRNILAKTLARAKWYLQEIVPLFVAASLLIWVGQLTGIFGLVIDVLKYPVSWMGLPPSTASAFLFGFFRRDYGVAGLYDQAGGLSGVQLLVATVALTLFMPCIAHFLITVKERGWKTGLTIAALTLVISFSVGAALSHILIALKVTL